MKKATESDQEDPAIHLLTNNSSEGEALRLIVNFHSSTGNCNACVIQSECDSGSKHRRSVNSTGEEKRNREDAEPSNDNHVVWGYAYLGIYIGINIECSNCANEVPLWIFIKREKGFQISNTLHDTAILSYRHRNYGQSHLFFWIHKSHVQIGVMVIVWLVCGLVFFCCYRDDDSIKVCQGIFHVCLCIANYCNGNFGLSDYCSSHCRVVSRYLHSPVIFVICRSTIRKQPRKKTKCNWSRD